MDWEHPSTKMQLHCPQCLLINGPGWHCLRVAAVLTAADRGGGWYQKVWTVLWETQNTIASFLWAHLQPFDCQVRFNVSLSSWLDAGSSRAPQCFIAFYGIWNKINRARVNEVTGTCKRICAAKWWALIEQRVSVLQHWLLKLNKNHAKFINESLGECSGFAKASTALKLLSSLDGTEIPKFFGW